MAIRLGIVGAGLFIRDAYVPQLRDLRDQFEVVAIASRTPESGAEVAAMFDTPVETTQDANALLQRDDIEAVLIALPITMMPEMVGNALRMGKHVLSEKPISPTVAAGRELLSLQRPGQVWLVAENYRHEPLYLQAAQQVQSGAIGRPVTASYLLYVEMNPTNKYYNTPWRRDNSFPGGFLMDGGVHYVAGLRLMLGEVRSVSGFVTQVRADLPPTDTVSASLQFESGVVASYSVSFASGAFSQPGFYIVGDAGVLHGTADTLTLHTPAGTQHLPIGNTRRGSIRAELEEFAAAVQDGQPGVNTPQQALRDVAVVEAMLDASARRIVVDVPVIE